MLFVIHSGAEAAHVRGGPARQPMKTQPVKTALPWGAREGVGGARSKRTRAEDSHSNHLMQTVNMMHSLCHTCAMLAVLFSGILTARAAPAQRAEPPHRSEFVCRWIDEPIVIDGRADEPAWNRADKVDPFRQPWLGDAQKPIAATRARLLWDRQFLYFHAEMDDADLFADIREHDGKTWLNDVFELFIKPATDKTGYYEFHVSAAGTVMDVFLPRRDLSRFDEFVRQGPFHLETQVVRRGTLNQHEDTDQGWSVEGKIPWTDLLRTGGRPQVNERWRFALCRYDYDQMRDQPDLSTIAPLGKQAKPDFHAYENYATLRFAGPGEEDAAARTPLTTSRVWGAPDPPPPFRAVPAMPHLKLDFPIFMIRQPSSPQLLFIDQPGANAASRICRTIGRRAESFEVLLPLTDIAYSIAFHPDFEHNGYLFVGSNGARSGGPKMSRVTRYRMDPQPPHTLHGDSAEVIIEWESNGHNGAAVTFGLDGMLYVTSGDGTSDSDDNVTGQGLDHLLAKVLRIDVDRRGDNRAYAIPGDNPFVDQPDVRAETWAYGLRNPWRITTDRETGQIWVGNNGQDLWEQAYLIQRGANYGWSVYEGSHPFYLQRKLGPTPVSPPTLEHPHSESRSLTGGIVYYGDTFPELRGAYIYGDYSTGKIWAARHDGRRLLWQRELADTSAQISAFAVGPDGDVLIADHRGNKQGAFLKLERTPPETAAHEFPQRLSESGLFRDVASHDLQPGMIAYAVNAPLWSDGSYKERFIGLPESAGVDGHPPRIDVTSKWGWNFPDGTVLVKSFALEMEEGQPDSRRWIETRFLTRQEGEWVGYSYRWNEAQTDAELVQSEGVDQAFTVRTATGTRKQAWRFPSRTECMVCHSRAANFVLGVSTAQLNRPHGADGTGENQLETFERLGILRMPWKAAAIQQLRAQRQAQGDSAEAIDVLVKALGPIGNQRLAPPTSLWPQDVDAYPRLVDPYDEGADLTARARSYLHANCAVCHTNAGGGNSQINLEFGVSDEGAKMIGVKPVHHTFGIPDAQLVAPGDPARSVLLHRVAIRGRGQMPQLATSRADERAVNMLTAWIEALAADAPTAEGRAR